MIRLIQCVDEQFSIKIDELLFFKFINAFFISNQTVGNKNTKSANSEFDYNSSLPVEKVSGSNNLVDMEACMGFNIPTNNLVDFGTGNSSTLPSSGIVPDDQSSVKGESDAKATVVKNPFFGKQQRLGSSNSTEALVDI